MELCEIYVCIFMYILWRNIGLLGSVNMYITAGWQFCVVFSAILVCQDVCRGACSLFLNDDDWYTFKSFINVLFSYFGNKQYYDTLIFHTAQQ